MKKEGTFSTREIFCQCWVYSNLSYNMRSIITKYGISTVVRKEYIRVLFFNTSYTTQLNNTNETHDLSLYIKQQRKRPQAVTFDNCNNNG